MSVNKKKALKNINEIKKKIVINFIGGKIVHTFIFKMKIKLFYTAKKS